MIHEKDCLGSQKISDGLFLRHTMALSCCAGMSPAPEGVKEKAGTDHRGAEMAEKNEISGRNGKGGGTAGVEGRQGRRNGKGGGTARADGRHSGWKDRNMK